MLALVLGVALAGCSGDDEEPVGLVRMAPSLGPGEGAVNLVALAGYVEYGASDPRVDWISGFEERTRCKVGLKVANTPQEMVSLMANPARRYDGVAAPPEVVGQLVAGRDVAPVNPDLVDGYRRLESRLRGLLKKGDTVYGVPYVWGANLLMYDQRAVQPAPAGWASVFDPAQAAKYNGKIIMRDSPLTIAEAALYLKSKRKSLNIKDPYSLNRKQLQAATEVLAKQHSYVKEYWEQSTDAVSAFAGGEAVLGQVWPYNLDVLTRAGRPVAAATPKEGTTGWLNSWMIGARAQHPNCMYQWLKWTASPDVQQQVAEWLGVAPANPEACSEDRLKSGFCGTYHVGDKAYLNKLIFAHTPSKDCGGGRHDCMDYAEWTKAWNQVLT